MSTGRVAFVLRPIPGNQLLRRRRPFWKGERETGVHEPAGNNPPAFENQFGFSAQQETADFDHPCRSRKANRLSPGITKSAHELAISQWIGGADIHRTGKCLICDQEVDGADEVGFMNPGDILSPGSLRSAEP